MADLTMAAQSLSDSHWVAHAILVHITPPRGAATGVGHTSRAVEDMAWAGGESFGCADIVVGAVEETSALGGEAKEEEEECERF